MEQGGESDVKLSTLQKCSQCGTHANWMTVTSELAKRQVFNLLPDSLNQKSRRREEGWEQDLPR